MNQEIFCDLNIVALLVWLVIGWLGETKNKTKVKCMEGTGSTDLKAVFNVEQILLYNINYINNNLYLIRN